MEKCGLDVTANVIEDCLHKRNMEIEENASECGVWDDEGPKGGYLNFEAFVHLLFDILQKSGADQHTQVTIGPYSFFKLFPLDPDSRAKKAWDAFCMILLAYCSFEVPYNIAFPTSDLDGLSPVETSELAVNVVFMIDIALSFVTAYDHQGIIVKRFRRIAHQYLRTWFIPDLAGSFPFDMLVAACLGKEGNLSMMRLIRMLKLVRAVKLMSRLAKLREKEGFETFGPVIGVGTAVFILIFTAHLLGCFLTMLAAAEPGKNWLSRYSDSLGDTLPEADNWTQYVVALYWATISITTMGNGDIVPTTTAERIMSIAIALVGAIVFSHCMGTISSLIIQVPSEVPAGSSNQSTGNDDRGRLREQE